MAKSVEELAAELEDIDVVELHDEILAKFEEDYKQIELLTKRVTRLESQVREQLLHSSKDDLIATITEAVSIAIVGIEDRLEKILDQLGNR